MCMNLKIEKELISYPNRKVDFQPNNSGLIQIYEKTVPLAPSLPF